MPLSDRVTIYILIVQIQPKKHVLDHAGHTGRTPQNMGYHHNDQEIYLSISVLKYLDHEVGIDHTHHLYNESFIPLRACPDIYERMRVSNFTQRQKYGPLSRWLKRPTERPNDRPTDRPVPINAQQLTTVTNALLRELQAAATVLL